MFYFYFESRNDPDNDPLVIWMTGALQVLFAFVTTGFLLIFLCNCIRGSAHAACMLCGFLFARVVVEACTCRVAIRTSLHERQHYQQEHDTKLAGGPGCSSELAVFFGAVLPARCLLR